MKTNSEKLNLMFDKKLKITKYSKLESKLEISDKLEINNKHGLLFPQVSR